MSNLLALSFYNCSMVEQPVLEGLEGLPQGLEGLPQGLEELPQGLELV
jgi:hypothetical protein